MGSPGRRPRRRHRRGRPAARRHARQHPPHAPRAEGPAGNAHGRRLPLVERAAARGIQALRQPASCAHHHPGRALRQDRPGRRARKSRRLLHRPRALHPHRRRSARRGDGHRRQHAPGQPPAARIRLRIRDRERAQEGHDRAQGQHHEGAERPVPGDGTGAVRAQVQGALRAGHGDHRRLRDEAGAQSVAVRRAGHHQPVRRHPVGPHRRAWSVDWA